jgi:hypothetical protein
VDKTIRCKHTDKAVPDGDSMGSFEVKGPRFLVTLRGSLMALLYWGVAHTAIGTTVRTEAARHFVDRINPERPNSMSVFTLSSSRNFMKSSRPFPASAACRVGY